jgi:hypothetical protein
MASPGAIFSARPVRASRVAELAEAAKAATPAGWGSVSTATADPPSLPAPPSGWEEFRAKLTKAAADRDAAQRALFKQHIVENEKWATDGAHGDPPRVKFAPHAPAEMSFRDAVSRWYDKIPGGLDAAIQSSQDSMARSGASGYGAWHPADVDVPADVYLEALGPSTGGQYRHGSGAISLNSNRLVLEPARQRGTLEHELTHAMTADPMHAFGHPEATGPIFRGPRVIVGNDGRMVDDWRSEDMDVLRPIVGRMEASRAALPPGSPLLLYDSDQPMRLAQYLTRRVEVDPRLADIRRRYAHTFGKDVTNTDEAQKAWDWWRESQDSWSQAANDRPSIDSTAFALYDALPDEAKKAMLVRMTQVPSVLAPIGASAGVLSGLTEER